MFSFIDSWGFNSEALIKRNISVVLLKSPPTTNPFYLYPFIIWYSVITEKKLKNKRKKIVNLQRP